VQAVNKEILGRESPEECEKVFDGRLKKLEIELEEMVVAKEVVEAMHVAVERVISFGVGTDGKRERIGDATLRKEKQEMRKEQENITKNRAERHNLCLAGTTGSESVKGGTLFSENKIDHTIENSAHFLHTKNNHLIMETISSQGEDAVMQCLSCIPTILHHLYIYLSIFFAEGAPFRISFFQCICSFKVRRPSFRPPPRCCALTRCGGAWG
jgi:hypothetical protein